MISCESLFQCPCFVFSEMQRRVSIQASFHTQGAEAASTAQKPLLQSCSEAKPQLGRMLLNTAHVCMLTDLAGRNLLEILEQEIRGDLMGRMKRLVAKSFKTLSSLQIQDEWQVHLILVIVVCAICWDFQRLILVLWYRKGGFMFCFLLFS